MTNRSALFRLPAACTFAVLAACGGGDDSTPAPPPPPAIPASPTCTGAEAFSVVADASVVVGKAAGAVIAGCTGALTEVLWTQIGGPAVALLSAKSQAISFEPSATGTHSFRVDFRDAGGVPRSATINVLATNPVTQPQILARVDQAVRKGGNVSLRAWPALAAGETLTWTQIAGPAVTLDTTDPNRVLFVAPDVARDTALVFRVTRRLANGAVDTDDAYVLVENYTQAPSDPSGTGPFAFSDLHVSRVHPYRATGPFAANLVRCTYEANLQYFGAGMNTCPLSTLPFLHSTTAGGLPTADQIMDRVVVSHDWMGDVFDQFLRTQANADLLRLFNGVTAIVIGAQVRPSFYYAVTGAIYLDADNFWLTAEQRDVINEAPDFRSDFDRDLMYSGVWRYTEASQSIFVNFPATSRISRDISYLLAESGWLLYHELAHASDFAPPAIRPTFNPAQTPWENIGPRFSAQQLPSNLLSQTYQLNSQEMLGLAQVKFQGATADATQRTYTPTQVGGFFAADRANDEYSYSTIREDLAMVFEEFMMFRNHGWRRDVAITDKITATTTSSNLIVRWGQRGRTGESLIRPRTTLVLQNLAPWVNVNEVTALPAPIAMRVGDSWAGNLVLPAPLGGLASIQRIQLEPDEDRRMLMRSLTGARHIGSPNERFVRRAGR